MIKITGEGKKALSKFRKSWPSIVGKFFQDIGPSRTEKGI